MDLVRAWLRAAVGASAAAVLVPVGLVAALIVVAVGGGFGGLGALGQAFSGPGIPAATTPARAVTKVSTAVATTATTVAAGAANAARTGAGGAGAASRPGGGSAGTGAGGRVVNKSGTGRGRHAGGGGSGGNGGSGGGGGRSSTADKVATTGKQVTGKAPAPVSSIGSQALDSLAHAVDGLLPPPK